MSYNLLFFIRKSRSEKNTNSLIYLRITINGSRAQMSISRSIPLNKWSSSKGQAKGTSKESKEINDHIDKLTYNLNKIHQNFMDSAQMITPNKMIRALNGIDDSDRKALEVFKEHNENLDQLIGKDISAASAQRYWTCHNHIKQFIKEYYKEDDYRLKDIDYTFITKFEHFLKSNFWAF